MQQAADVVRCRRGGSAAAAQGGAQGRKGKSDGTGNGGRSQPRGTPRGSGKAPNSTDLDGAHHCAAVLMMDSICHHGSRFGVFPFIDRQTGAQSVRAGLRCAGKHRKNVTISDASKGATKPTPPRTKRH